MHEHVCVHIPHEQASSTACSSVLAYKSSCAVNFFCFLNCFLRWATSSAADMPIQTHTRTVTNQTCACARKHASVSACVVIAGMYLGGKCAHFGVRFALCVPRLNSPGFQLHNTHRGDHYNVHEKNNVCSNHCFCRETL